MESPHQSNQTPDTAATARPSLTDYRTPSSEHRAILDAALTEFSNRGYYEGRLDNISLESGISKRMIHYHFGDKRGLYLETLRLAANCLRPTDAELVSFSGVPVDAVRLLVETLVDRFLAEPRATRLLAMENLFGILDVDTELSILGQSPVVLMIDKLLMHGLDYGAFRPGVSAIDIYLMINSLAMFPSFNRRSFRSLYGVDLNDSDNRRGLRRLISDAVIAFLTSTLPSKPTDSYLPTSRGVHQGVHPVDPYAQDFVADNAAPEAPSLTKSAHSSEEPHTSGSAQPSSAAASKATTSTSTDASEADSPSASEPLSPEHSELSSRRNTGSTQIGDSTPNDMAGIQPSEDSASSPTSETANGHSSPGESQADTNALALEAHHSIYPLDDPSHGEAYEQFNGLGDGGTSFDKELSGNPEVQFGSRTPSSRRAVQLDTHSTNLDSASDATQSATTTSVSSHAPQGTREEKDPDTPPQASDSDSSEYRR